MIQDDQQLQQSIEQLERMYRALSGLRARHQASDPVRYQLLAEGPAEEVRRLQQEIDAYLGVTPVESASK